VTKYPTAPNQDRARRCIATGETLPTSTLLRFVIGPEGTVVPDIDEKLPGRGLWLSAERNMIETASIKRLFSRAARKSVVVPDNLVEMVAELLKQSCLRKIGLANRAGLVAVGYERVCSRIEEGGVGTLFEAADGSRRERQKVVVMAPDMPVIDLFTRSELGGALGRESTVHMIVANGRLAMGLLRDVARYSGVQHVTA